MKNFLLIFIGLFILSCNGESISRSPKKDSPTTIYKEKVKDLRSKIKKSPINTPQEVETLNENTTSYVFPISRNFLTISSNGGTPGAIPLSIPIPPIYPGHMEYLENLLLKGVEICELNLPFLDGFVEILKTKRTELLENLEEQDPNLLMLDKIEGKTLLLKKAYEDLARILKLSNEAIQKAPLTKEEKKKWIIKYIPKIGVDDMTTFPGPVEVSAQFRNFIEFKKEDIELAIKKVHDLKTELEQAIEKIPKDSSSSDQSKTNRIDQGINWSRSTFDVLRQLYLINESHFRDTSTYLKTYLSKRDTKAQNELDSLLGSCKKQNGKLNDKIEEVNAFVDRIKDFFSGKTIYFNYTEERDKKSLTAEQKQEYITELQERYRIKIRNQLILYTHLFERSRDFVFKKPKAIENLQAGEREEAELRE